MSEFEKYKGRERPIENLNVEELSSQQLHELESYLRLQNININQRMLQSGTASAGYKKQGVIELEDGKIGFLLRDHSYIVVGTPLDFLSALRKINPEL